MNSIPNLPEDIWYKILSEISLSTVVYRGGEEYTQISIVNSMFHNIYKEVLSIQISKSILDDIFQRVCYDDWGKMLYCTQSTKMMFGHTMHYV